MKHCILLLSLFSSFNLVSQTHDWVKSFGSSNSDRNSQITITPKGDVVSIGYYTGTVDFDPSSNISNSTSNGSRDISICSFSSTGSFLWKNTVGSTGEDLGVSITSDTSGNIYTTGGFSNTCDFDPSGLTSNLTSNGDKDVFITKLDSAGNLIWAKSFGGTGEDRGLSIKVTERQEVVVAGFFRGTVDFDPGSGTTNRSSNGGEDGFICMLDSIGDLLWVNTYGSSSFSLRERGRAIEIDDSGDIILCGHFSGTVDFDPGTGVSNVTSSGSIDSYLTKLNSSGALIWVKTWGGIREDYTTDFIRSDSNNFYITGLFEGTSDFNPSSSIENKTSNGSFDPFVLKLDQSGIFKWVKTIGSNSYDAATSITIDQNENIIFSGFFNNVMDCDPDTSVFNISSPGPQIGFACKLLSNGDFDWAFPIKSTSTNSTTDDVYSNKTGIIYITGSFSGSNIDFDPQATISALSSNGNIDAFIHKIIDCITTRDTVFKTACNSYVSPSGKFTWNTNGIYNDTLNSILGCDSLLTINLSIIKSRDTINVSSCSSFISPSGNYSWDSTGTYYDTIPITPGCDSLFTINLTIVKPDTSFTALACKSYISPSGKTNWNSSGVYNDTLTSSLGCDSILTITLALVKPDTSVTANDPILTSNSSGVVTYQWLDCANSYFKINGATSQVYTATYNSSFAVEINNSGCKDTSACYQILTIGLTQASNVYSSIKIYPNPSSGNFNVELPARYSSTQSQYKLIDITGKTILNGSISKTNSTINSNELNKGIYFLQLLFHDGETAIEKLVIK